MVVTPPVTATSAPDRASMVATEVVPLIQVPPPAILVSVVVLPEHIAATPSIGPGDGLTVTENTEEQPDPKP